MVVFQFAGAPVEAGAPEAAEVPTPIVEPEAQLQSEVRAVDESRSRWPLVGIVVPGLIFLSATWITAGLHRHFTTHGH